MRPPRPGEYLSIQPMQSGPLLERLPLVTLYLSERCNSRCVTCDYWRHGRADMSLASITALMPALARLQTRVALISGGEPLLNPEWQEIARLLNANGLKLWLLTSGLSLAKHAVRVAELFDSITVSLDGTNPSTYASIRGLDAFDKVCAGIRAAAAEGARVSVRTTLQRANFRELPQFVDLSSQLGARQISFLAVDVANPHAFGRTDHFGADIALRCEDLPELDRLLQSMEGSHREAFRSGFIAESPRKLRRIYDYFSALHGRGPYPSVRCNAPEFSAVIDAKGNVHPCFFIAGPASLPGQGDLDRVLNDDAMGRLRSMIRAGERSECSTCVCSMWRDPGAREMLSFS
jgi:radical SAM protein with 4Fe4S-binding SPASM domain